MVLRTIKLVTIFLMMFTLVFISTINETLAIEILNKENLDYEITGGTVNSIEADEILNSLIIKIQAEDDGKLTVTLPRAFIDSTIGDTDDDFFILVDGEEVVAEEISTTSKARTFIIPFNQGTGEIEIIGTTINVSALSEPIVVEPAQVPAQPEGGGCLIATAAFGSEMAPQVQFLREIRDSTVLQTESGFVFMTGFNQFYYSFSPAIADYERENPIFKEAVKLTLTPLLTSLTLLQYVDIDSESEMLGYGIGVIFLNIGMYFVAPAILVMKARKR